MNLLEINPGDDYDMLTEYLVKKGRLKRRPDGDSLEEEKKRLQYWDGKKWGHERVMNERYHQLPIP